MNKEDKISSTSFAKSVASNIVIRLVEYLTPLILLPYISRVLEPRGIGEYSYAFSIASYFVLVIAFGFSDYGTKVISESRNDCSKVSLYFWGIFIARGMLFISTLIAYLVLVGNNAFDSKVNTSIYFALVALMIGSFLDTRFLYQGIENLSVFSIINVVVNIIYALTVVLLVKSYDDLFVYTLLKSSLTGIVSMISIIPIRKIIFPIHIKGEVIKEAFIGGIKYFIPGLVVKMTPIIDETMLGLMTTTTQVGYYESVNKIKMVLISLVYAIAPMILSRVAYLNKNDSKEEASGKITNTVLLVLYILIPSIAGLYMLSDLLIPLYFGLEYVPAISTMYMLLPSVAFSGIATLLLNGYYYALGLTKQATALLIICDTSNVLLNYYLIKSYGAAGVAFASSLTNGALCVLCFVFAGRMVQKTLFRKNMAKIMVSTIIMTGTIYVLRIIGLSSAGNLQVIIISTIIGMLTYLIITVITRCYPTQYVVSKFRLLRQKR